MNIDREAASGNEGAQRLLGIFAKYWQPGSVKTRLAAAIGAEQAARLQLEFLRTLLRRFAPISAARVLAYSPRQRESDFASLAGSVWEIAPQSSGDLGERMDSFFRSALACGYNQVVLIGSDSPTMPFQFIEQAFELLATHSVVLGPSDDGGYYLIGASKDSPPTFIGIDWGTPRVYGQTLSRLVSAQIPVAQLPPWYDVDEIEDLQRISQELQGNRDAMFSELAVVVRDALGSER